MFSTLVLTLFVREEWRQLTTVNARRSIWTEHRITLILTLILLPGSDIFGGIVRFTSVDINIPIQEIVGIQLMVVTLGQLVVAAYYGVQSRRLGAELKLYIHGHDMSQESASARILGRVAFWLAVSGACMFLHGITFAGTLCAMFGGYEISTPLFAFCLFTSISARIGVSYAKLQVIRQHRKGDRVFQLARWLVSQRRTSFFWWWRKPVKVSSLENAKNDIGSEIISALNSQIQIVPSFRGLSITATNPRFSGGDWVNPLDPWPLPVEANSMNQFTTEEFKEVNF
jgi:hypothetical protein